MGVNYTQSDYLFLKHFINRVNANLLVEDNEKKHFSKLLNKYSSSFINQSLDVNLMKETFKLLSSINNSKKYHIVYLDLKIKEKVFDKIVNTDSYKHYYKEYFKNLKSEIKEPQVLECCNLFIQYIEKRSDNKFYYQVLFDGLHIHNLDFDFCVKSLNDPSFYIELIKNSKEHEYLQNFIKQEYLAVYFKNLILNYNRFFKNRKTDLRKNKVNKELLILSLLKSNSFEISTIELHDLLHFRYTYGDNYFFKELIRIVDKKKLKKKLNRGKRLRHIQNARNVSYSKADAYQNYIKDLLKIEIEVEANAGYSFNDFDLESRLYLINTYEDKYLDIFEKILRDNLYQIRGYKLFFSENDKELMNLNYKI